MASDVNAHKLIVLKCAKTIFNLYRCDNRISRAFYWKKRKEVFGREKDDLKQELNPAGPVSIVHNVRKK